MTSLKSIELHMELSELKDGTILQSVLYGISPSVKSIVVCLYNLGYDYYFSDLCRFIVEAFD